MDEDLNHQLDFLEACSVGDVDRVRLLLSGGHVDINFHHRVNGWTALHWAARRGHDEVVKLLLSEGFDALAVTKEGKTPAGVAIEERIRRLFSSGDDALVNDTHTEMITINGTGSEVKSNEKAKRTGNGVVRSMSGAFNDSSLKAVKKAFSVDSNNSSSLSTPPDSPTTPTKNDLYSYGSGDSLNRTRFILVRTSSGFGKEAFKRVTLPGGGTVECLKLTIERAMKMGRVVQVVTLPDRIPIETDEQIRSLADSQKVEVVFEPFRDDENQQINRKFSLAERTTNEAKKSFVKRPPFLQRKAASMAEEYVTLSEKKLTNGGHASENFHNGGTERVLLNGDFEHSTTNNGLHESSPPSSAPAIGLEHSVSSNCSFNASSSYAKARVVLSHHQVVNDNAALVIPVVSKPMNGALKEKEDESLVEGASDEPQIQVFELEKEQPMSEVDVSCECCLNKSTSPAESAVSSVPCGDVAKADEKIDANKRTIKKISQILGAKSDEELESMLRNEEVGEATEKGDKAHRLGESFSTLKVALLTTAAVVCFGGIGYYFYSRSK